MQFHMQHNCMFFFFFFICLDIFGAKIPQEGKSNFIRIPARVSLGTEVRSLFYFLYKFSGVRGTGNSILYQSKSLGKG